MSAASSKYANRIAEHFGREADGRIRFETDRNIAYYSRLDPAAIDHRLAELDREWNVDRILETNGAALTLVSFVLGAV